MGIRPLLFAVCNGGGLKGETMVNSKPPVSIMSIILLDYMDNIAIPLPGWQGQEFKEGTFFQGDRVGQAAVRRLQMQKSSVGSGVFPHEARPRNWARPPRGLSGFV